MIWSPPPPRSAAPWACSARTPYWRPGCPRVLSPRLFDWPFIGNAAVLAAWGRPPISRAPQSATSEGEAVPAMLARLFLQHRENRESRPALPPERQHRGCAGREITCPIPTCGSTLRSDELTLLGPHLGESGLRGRVNLGFLPNPAGIFQCSPNPRRQSQRVDGSGAARPIYADDELADRAVVIHVGVRLA